MLLFHATINEVNIFVSKVSMQHSLTIVIGSLIDKTLFSRSSEFSQGKGQKELN